ncbi:MAG TPA: MFS transporter [Pseudonocardiaceae bacterium]|nr:MFS transporter [Pseudonocardiaceae bacterium]
MRRTVEEGSDIGARAGTTAAARQASSRSAARWALTAVFATDGMVFASWSSRLPRIEATVHADNGGLGIALLGTALGAFVAMPVTGWLCRNIAPRLVVLVALGLLCGGVLLPGLASSPGALLLTLLVFGAGYGSVDVSMNAAAVEIGAEVGRPILPSFHAAFSIGALVGATAGGLAGAAAIPVEAHLAVVAAIAAGCLVAVARPLAGRSGPTGRRPVRRESIRLRLALPALLVAAMLTFGSAFGEGATATWAAVHLSQDAHTSAGVAPLGFAIFSLAEAVGRMTGTQLTERWGAGRVVGAGAVLAAGGFVLTLVPVLAVLLVGYLAAGLGLSCLFPLGIARAGRAAGSVGVSVASLLGYAGFLVGPPLVGLLASATNLTVALGVPVVLAVGIIVVAAIGSVSEEP